MPKPNATRKHVTAREKILVPSKLHSPWATRESLQSFPPDRYPHPSHYKAISASSVITSLSVGCETVKIKETIKKKQDQGYDLKV